MEASASHLENANPIAYQSEKMSALTIKALF
jgi:hypothetical protein